MEYEFYSDITQDGYSKKLETNEYMKWIVIPFSCGVFIGRLVVFFITALVLL